MLSHSIEMSVKCLEPCLTHVYKSLLGFSQGSLRPIPQVSFCARILRNVVQRCGGNSPGVGLVYLGDGAPSVTKLPGDLGQVLFLPDPKLVYPCSYNLSFPTWCLSSTFYIIISSFDKLDCPFQGSSGESIGCAAQRACLKFQPCCTLAGCSPELHSLIQEWV